MNVSKNESQYLSQKDGGAVSSMANVSTFDPTVEIPGDESLNTFMSESQDLS